MKKPLEITQLEKGGAKTQAQVHLVPKSTLSASAQVAMQAASMLRTEEERQDRGRKAGQADILSSQRKDFITEESWVSALLGRRSCARCWRKRK